MGRRIEESRERDASLPAGVIAITHRERVEFIFVPAFLLVLQPVAPVLFAIYISCYAPDDKCFRRPGESAKSLPPRARKKKIDLHSLSAFERSNYLD